MDVNDLMLGDWVMNACGTPRKVYELVQDQVTYELEGGGLNTTHCNQLYPIPLTEEILVKNGWDFRDRQYAIECKEDEQGIVELSRDKDGYYWSINWDEYLIIRIHYVHELQHILRLCGIEKEIEL